MKKLLLSLIAMMIATLSFAQSQIATLSHGNEIKTFYGPSSFKSAMEAADNGDVITLSSGQFEAANITKAITLRGSGMVELNDDMGYHAPTIIQGNLHINMSDSTQTPVSIEGVKFINSVSCKNLNNPIFTKCNLYSINNLTGSNYNVRNAILVNCRVREFFYITDGATATFINSIVNRPYSRESNVNTSFVFINCVLTDIRNNYTDASSTQTSSDKSYLTYSSFRNCYLSFYVGTYTSANAPFVSLSNTNLVTNCYSAYSDAFENISNTTNKVVSGKYKSWGGASDDNIKFQLTDDAAKTCLGDDGTQMGIYGGNMPYDELISMPYITKCNVAGKSTSDGKLSVDIEVNVK